ncbi:MAG: hypothetical protein B0D92_05795 [Spirochaeta sp. LUC14_002_19_P3]|nr:MAG: hypothetical protein B0D92_05795 [Spirochaeta sp. LUC14_002_19_P3]
MKIVIASDSWKGSNTSIQAAVFIENGARRVFPRAQYMKIPIADGGEGTVAALTEALGGRIIEVPAEDPLQRPITAFYGAIGDKAVMEMAAASGLPLLAKEEKNPLTASSRGTGQLIAAALEAGYTDITIGIGGSATNDGGAGMAQALGYRLLDTENRELKPGGGELIRLAKIDPSGAHPLLKSAAIRIACDVDNPLLGSKGASRTYGPQKGADESDIVKLEAALSRFADIAEKWKGETLRNIPGTGAAGGLGFGLLAFCGAEMQSGIETILSLVNFDRHLQGASLVITGEGRIDGQSIHGKTPMGIAAHAKAAGIPVVAIVGSLGTGASAIYEYGIDALMPTVDTAMSLSDAIARSRECLEDTAERACRLIRIGMDMQETLKAENRKGRMPE